MLFLYIINFICALVLNVYGIMDGNVAAAIVGAAIYLSTIYMMEKK